MSMGTVVRRWDPTHLRTKQEMKDECDINLILKRFQKTRMVSHLAKGVPQFGDVSEVTDFRSAVERVGQAQRFFEGLPSNVRKEFGNDPVAFVDAFSDEASRPRLEALGLVPKREAPAPEGGAEAGGTVPS